MTQNDQMGERQTSIVGACGATDCRYNEDRECHAGQIQVGMAGNMAQCMTYDPTGDQSGMTDMPRVNPS
ncbi:DUF1540 domain-containing protein [Deinococcus peraridilitoris]|uniref:DUF1540 domain-containing protein n=1 Tax=Deinococcus peraridilitoris (strain DSM 19664 / LMG 22246 / CIP 109416 / KR-200) TaxID=937777 RepID=L0A7F7_DEIPD|nr:DUF1540 domain-containing protein [Deinococcus peraridilitoris]AFZ68995.1 protein of unknown function (DUF1540) [Deinococcus peraridilitoris DSM 19664]